MSKNSLRVLWLSTVVLLTAAGTSSSVVKAEPGYAILHKFTSQQGYPVSGVISDSAGVLYGNAAGLYQNSDAGVVFRLTPPVPGTSKWDYQALHEFSSFDGQGANPLGGLTQDDQGVLYGVLANSAIDDAGSVFSLSPPLPGKSKWRFNLLKVFGDQQKEGADPLAAMIRGKDGTLYGTTETGGDCYDGTVFSLSPPVPPSKLWVHTILHGFVNHTDPFPGCPGDGGKPNGGGYPHARLVMDKDGVLYGTASEGGNGGYGTVFRLLPPAPGKKLWKFSVVYWFCVGGIDYVCPGGDGADPEAGLTFGPDGKLYGTTSGGGVNPGPGHRGFGTVFSLTKDPDTGRWKYKQIKQFSKNGDLNQHPESEHPQGGLVVTDTGVIYGTNSGSGANPKELFDPGLVFSLSPAGPGKWDYRAVHWFSAAEAYHPLPRGDLIERDGVLYGTTFHGGLGYGAVFSLKP